MASLTSIFSLGQIERYLFRPLFVFFTFCLVLLAIFQASGRFTMASLALFEEDINMLLNSQNINVAGLRGSWRGLNPVVTVERIEFPAGEVSRLEAELDVLESMFRSAPIARLVAAEQLELHTERTADGWRLRGMPAQAQQFDFMDSLRHSDELRGRVRVHLYNLVQPNGMVQDTLEAEVLVTNRGGVHHADLALRNVSDGGELIARAWQRDSLWPITDEALAFVLQGGVRIP